MSCGNDGLLGESAGRHDRVRTNSETEELRVEKCRTRRAGGDEPQRIFRLRKVCLHVLAINCWEIGAEVEHVMASELRAAYEQMEVVWWQLPAEYRFYEGKEGWWRNEARNGMSATYDHPTPTSLLLLAGHGGLSEGEESAGYARLAGWLAGLGFGYLPALAALAEALAQAAVSTESTKANYGESTASPTVLIFSASPSGISIPYSSSKAITNTKMSSESAPKSPRRRSHAEAPRPARYHADRRTRQARRGDARRALR